MTLIQFQSKLDCIPRIEKLLNGKQETGASAPLRQQPKNIVDVMRTKGIRVPR